MLKAELEEAWREAEGMAREMDVLEGAAVSDDDDEDITTHTAHVVGVTGKAIVTHAKLLASTDALGPTVDSDGTQPQPQSEAEPEVAPSRPSRSRRSSRSDRGSRWSRVAAAKTRSRRTSNASLRMTKRSLSRAYHTSESNANPPPVPELPGSLHEGSFLELESRNASNAEDIATKHGKIPLCYSYP